MPNLSQLRRQKMLGFLDRIRKEHTDDESLAAISEIENALTAKKYGLVWEEHEERADVEMKQGIPVWTEDAGKEIISGADLPVHFLLEGDNLHSLRLLEKTHSGRVDLIYIDPPYNRGKTDFIYDDNYVAAEDGFRHSKWLSFMGKRLLAARELLSKKGLLFISVTRSSENPASSIFLSGSGTPAAKRKRISSQSIRNMCCCMPKAAGTV